MKYSGSACAFGCLWVLLPVSCCCLYNLDSDSGGDKSS